MPALDQPGGPTSRHSNLLLLLGTLLRTSASGGRVSPKLGFLNPCTFSPRPSLHFQVFELPPRSRTTDSLGERDYTHCMRLPMNLDEVVLGRTSGLILNRSTCTCLGGIVPLYIYIIYIYIYMYMYICMYLYIYIYIHNISKNNKAVLASLF